MVERFHRQLKAAIICHQTTDWVSILPIVLLGIRAAYKEDVNATATELVYGETIRLPGEFFHPSETEDTNGLLHTLRETMRRMKPQPVKQHGQQATFVHKKLEEASHVFVRPGIGTPALCPAYEGPYEVLQRTTKNFKITINGKTTNITADRLKPAFLLETQEEREVQLAKAEENTTRTKCGRASRPPVRFAGPALPQRRG